jgi:hypothetical protein
MGTTRSRGVWAIDLTEEGLKYRPEKKLNAKFKEIAEEFAFGSYYVLLFTFMPAFFWILMSRNTRSAPRNYLLMVIGACFFLYLAEQFIIYPERKYRYPLEIFMIIMDSGFLVHLIRDFKFRK